MTAPGRAPRDWLLATTARRIPGVAPTAPLTREHVALMAELTIWDWHGTADPTPESRADAHLLREALDRIPINDGDTRDEYATRIQLAARGVAL
ncbi:hypothetical protein ACGFWI_01145 [Streptomyces sp. NPDC048434]|uniref:hypothetical protein n=1 Tax=Streptomyces sp. NPDC048434 TaxID=3365549 RepID=UPI003713B9A1